jgi:hypothetical protein
LKDTFLPSLRHFTKEWLFQTTPVRHLASRSTHRWTRFINLPITRTWHVIWHLFLQEFLVWNCVRLSNMPQIVYVCQICLKLCTSVKYASNCVRLSNMPQIVYVWQICLKLCTSEKYASNCVRLRNMPQTPFFSNSPKKNKSQDDRSGERAGNKCHHHKSRYFWKSLYGHCTLDSRPQTHVFIKRRIVAEATANLVSVLSPGLHEYYVNQNDKLTLPPNLLTATLRRVRVTIVVV